MPPPPPSSPPDLPPGSLAGEDATLVAAVSMSLPTFSAFLVGYLVLHTLFRVHYYRNPLLRGKGPQPPAHVLGFLRLIWHMTDDQLEEWAGLDAFALLLFLKVVLRVLGKYAAYTLTANLVTMWAHAHYGDGGVWEGPPGGLARISIANLRAFDGDPWAAPWDRWLPAVTSVVGAWLLTYLTVSELNRSWKRMLARRLASLTDARDASSLTCLVRGGGLLGKTYAREEMLKLWTLLYPGAIHDIRIVRDTGELRHILSAIAHARQDILTLEQKIAKLRKKLSKAVDKKGDAKASAKLASLDAGLAGLDPNPPPRPAGEKKKGGGRCDRRPLPAKLSSQRTELATLYRDLAAEHARVGGAENERGSSYFVLFRDHRSSNIARQVTNTGSSRMVVGPAPLSADVRWASLEPRAEKRLFVKKRISSAAFAAMLCFYLIPIQLVSAVLQLDELLLKFPALRPVIESMPDAAVAFLKALLPTLALVLFLIFLPAVCTAFASHMGFESIGKMHRDAFSKLFLFQFVSVFLGVTMGSSALALVTNLQKIASDPFSILTTLGDQLAASAVFFMVYLTLQLPALTMGELMRAVPVIKSVLLERVAALTADKPDPAPAATAPSAGLSPKAPQLDEEAAGLVLARVDVDVGEHAPPQPPSPPPSPPADGEATLEAPPPAPKPPPPEPFLFHVHWSKVMLATTLGMCYASIQPTSVFFAWAYLGLAYVYYARGLLFSYTHASESRGSFWPFGSSRLLAILIVSQLMLTGVHSIKKNVLTAALVFLSIVPAWLARSYFTRQYEPQLATLPLIRSATTDEQIDAVDGDETRKRASRLSVGSASRPPVELGRAATLAKAEYEEAKFGAIFGDSYIQPELLEAAELLRELQAHAASERKGSLYEADVDGHSDHTRLSRPHKRSRRFSLSRAEQTGDAY